MKLIVGLGNPGLKYQKTRHNIGFMFLDEIARDLKLEFTLNKQLKSLVANTTINGEKIIFIKPQTFMNLSGEAVLAVVNYYKLDVDNILVVYDDLDLPVGKIRIRKNGSSGGHKGMNNIIELLKTTEIKRIRIGIMNTSKIDTVDYVLGRFNEEDLSLINLAISQAPKMLESFLVDTFDDFMNKFNRSNIDE
jgi:PTH1 family peptidyl-tRNA hydrolase